MNIVTHPIVLDGGRYAVQRQQTHGGFNLRHSLEVERFWPKLEGCTYSGPPPSPPMQTPESAPSHTAARHCGRRLLISGDCGRRSNEALLPSPHFSSSLPPRKSAGAGGRPGRCWSWSAAQHSLRTRPARARSRAAGAHKHVNVDQLCQPPLLRQRGGALVVALAQHVLPPQPIQSRATPQTGCVIVGLARGGG